MAGLVVVGRTKSPLVEKIATNLKAPVVGFHLEWFADTEPSLTLERQEFLSEKTALVVFQIDLMFEHNVAKHSVNDHIAGLLHLIASIKQAGATSIIAVLPYLPYARQEKGVTARQQGPLAMWGTVFKTAGIDHIITCDIHAPASITCLGSMAHNINTTQFWANHIKGIIPPELPVQQSLCIVSPDHGGLERAQRIAQELNCAYTFVDKVRIAKDTPVVLGINSNIQGKTTIIVDDIIDTAHTAANACQLLHNHGAQTIIGCFTHAVFSSQAHQRLAVAGFEKILITDTLTSAIKQVEAHLQVCSITDYLVDHVCQMVKKI